MNAHDFEVIVDTQMDRVNEILFQKAKEYATDGDRLHNFKVAATLQGVTNREAVVNLMSKHTVSIFDMARSDEDFSLAQWDEKITDHINYLILLRAVVDEDESFKSIGVTTDA